MTHGADDGVDHDLQARGDDRLVTGVGDSCVGDCACGEEGKDISGLLSPMDRIREREEKEEGGFVRSKKRLGNNSQGV